MLLLSGPSVDGWNEEVLSVEEVLLSSALESDSPYRLRSRDGDDDRPLDCCGDEDESPLLMLTVVGKHAVLGPLPRK